MVQSQEAAETDFNETPGTKLNYSLEPGVSLESVLPTSCDRITQKETPSEGGGFPEMKINESCHKCMSRVAHE